MRPQTSHTHQAKAAQSPRSSKPSSTVPTSIADGLFQVRRKLDEGCFGEVYAGQDTRTGDPVAIKIETNSNSDLEREVAILKLLNQTQSAQGFAKFYHYGREGKRRVFVMERLGRSLMDIWRATAEQRLSAKTTCLVAEQALRCLETLHAHGIVHRDIKPENFMCGVGTRKHHLYLIDFGMSAEYFSNNRHVPYSEIAGFSGNLRYASINAHRLCRQSRRDDLEALGHMLHFFLRGSLPWSGIPARNWKEQNRKVMEKKEATPLTELTAHHPVAFRDYLEHCRGLRYSSRPDYFKLRHCFVELREQLSKKQGSVVEDTEVEWVKTADRPQCLPLQPYRPIMQPDDQRPEVLQSGSRGASGWSEKLRAGSSTQSSLMASAHRLTPPSWGRLCGGRLSAAEPNSAYAVAAM